MVLHTSLSIFTFHRQELESMYNLVEPLKNLRHYWCDGSLVRLKTPNLGPPHDRCTSRRKTKVYIDPNPEPLPTLPGYWRLLGSVMSGPCRPGVVLSTSRTPPPGSDPLSPTKLLAPPLTSELLRLWDDDRSTGFNGLKSFLVFQCHSRKIKSSLFRLWYLSSSLSFLG